MRIEHDTGKVHRTPVPPTIPFWRLSHHPGPHGLLGPVRQEGVHRSRRASGPALEGNPSLDLPPVDTYNRIRWRRRGRNRASSLGERPATFRPPTLVEMGESNPRPERSLPSVYERSRLLASAPAESRPASLQGSLRHPVGGRIACLPEAFPRKGVIELHLCCRGQGIPEPRLDPVVTRLFPVTQIPLGLYPAGRPAHVISSRPLSW